MNKLAIVGTHPDTRNLAPFDDASYEIWVFNEAPQMDWCRRWDVCFQLHKPEVYTSLNNWVIKSHWAWLQEDHPGKTIYMQDWDERVPACSRYPLEEIIETLPGAQFRWITSSGSYALALALYQGYEEIEIYGIELSSNTEYSYQLENWQYWVGVAIGMGVKLKLASGQMHFAKRLYGYDGETQIERDYFLERVGELDQAWKEAEREVIHKRDRASNAILERKYDKLAALQSEWQNAAIAAGQLAGAMGEAKYYSGRPDDDPITRQEFERRAAYAQRDGEALRVLMYQTAGKTEYIWNVWKTYPQNYEAVKQLRKFLGDQMQFAYDFGAKLGAHEENKRYMVEYDERVTAAGGQRTLAAIGGN